MSNNVRNQLLLCGLLNRIPTINGLSVDSFLVFCLLRTNIIDKLHGTKYGPSPKPHARQSNHPCNAIHMHEYAQTSRLKEHEGTRYELR